MKINNAAIRTKKSCVSALVVSRRQKAKAPNREVAAISGKSFKSRLSFELRIKLSSEHELQMRIMDQTSADTGDASPIPPPCLSGNERMARHRTSDVIMPSDLSQPSMKNSAFAGAFLPTWVTLVQRRHTLRFLQSLTAAYQQYPASIHVEVLTTDHVI